MPKKGLTGLRAVGGLVLALLAGMALGNPAAHAQSVEFGVSMDQAFSSNPYTGGWNGQIPPGWTNLPWGNPANWPITGHYDNMWQGKTYVVNPSGQALTVQSGQTVTFAPPNALEDVCQASNYGTRGHWRGLFVMATSGNQEAWNWNPPGGQWMTWGAAMNNEAGGCSPGSVYSAWPQFTLTAPPVSQPTTYYARFFGEEAQYTSTSRTTIDADISGVKIPVTVLPPAQPPSVTLTANPTRLPVGNWTTLTATASNLPSGDTVQFQNLSVQWQGGSGQPGQSTVTMTDNGHNQPNTWTYDAVVVNPGGQIVATSNQVTVTWYANAPPPSVSLSANPTNLSVGQATTLTATANILPSNDYLVIQNNTVGWPNLNDATPGNPGSWADYTGQSSFTVIDNGPSAPATWHYTAYILSGPGQIVAQSNSVAVTWMATAPPAQNPTVTLSANPTSLPVCNATTVSAQAANMTSGDYVAITGTDGAGTSGASGAESVTLNDTQCVPTTATYTAVIRNAGGQTVATANAVAVTWTSSGGGGGSSGWIVHLTAHPTSLLVGQATTLTATANQDVGPTPYYINIVDTTTGRVIDSCGSGTTCTTTVTENVPTTHLFQADVGGGGAGISTNDQAISGAHAVTWAASLSVHLVASPSSLMVGQPTTLTATTQDNVATIGEDINIVDTTTGVVIQTCSSGTTCTAQVTEYQATTYNFQADIGPYQALPSAGGVQALSAVHAVTWNPWTVSLSARPTHLDVGHATTLTASVVPAVTGTGESLNIEDTSTGQMVGSCSTGATCQATVTESQPTTQVFEADVGPAQAPVSAARVVGTSSPVTVVWVAPAPQATGCVPYQPGYRYVNGQPTYDPKDCPVPTPVNF